MTTGSPREAAEAPDIEAMLKEAASFRSPWTKRYGEALSAYDTCIVKLAGSDTTAARHAVARAKLGKGNCYFDLKNVEEGWRFLEAFAAEPDGDDPFVANLHSQALLTVGQKLVAGELLEEAVAVFQTGLDRFASNSDDTIHNTVSLLFLNLGSALTAQKRDRDALANYDRLFTHLQTSSGSTSADEIADALWRKGHCLKRLGRTNEAFHAWSLAIDRFGDNDNCMETVSEIRLSYAGALIESGLAVEARRQCDAVIATARIAWGDLKYAVDDEGQYRKWKWMKRVQEAEGKLKDLSPGGAPDSGTA